MIADGFACAAARHRRVRAGGVDLHLLEWGEPGRPALCFLHGGAAHAHWFDRVVPAFVDRYHVIALDQRGHGESSWASPPAYATEDFAADLGAVADALGWDRLAIVGHSMGGHNAIAFAAWWPDRVRALVVADSRPAIPEHRLAEMHERGARPLRRHPGCAEAARAFRLRPRETVAAPELLLHLGETGVVERHDGWVLRFDPETNRSRRPTDGWALLGKIEAPTLVLRAERSPILTDEMTERMLEHLPGAELVVIPDAYHHLTLDAPEAVARVILDFLDARGR